MAFKFAIMYLILTIVKPMLKHFRQGSSYLLGANIVRILE